jgi:hypothetical protein
MDRKPMSKKIRFEVFKRDGFRCGYCGKTPPEVVLEVDHIEPISKGGSDSIDNLLTACFDCNRGKRDIPLNKVPPVFIEKAEVLQEKEDQLRQYRAMLKKVENRIQKDIDDVQQVFSIYHPGKRFAQTFRFSVKKFIDGLSKETVIDAMHIACSRGIKDGNGVLAYFCGICWKKIRGE